MHVYKTHQCMSRLDARLLPSQSMRVEKPQPGTSNFSFVADCDPAQLRREASALHCAAFGRDVPEKIADRYIEAHSVALPRVAVRDEQWMECVIAAETDLEALELALRTRESDHVLCQKLKLLIYITEAFPEYYGEFVNERPQRARAFWILAFHCARTLYKHLKGWCLFRNFT